MYLDIKSLYPHLKVNWNMLMCKICIARRLVVDIFPWCNANSVPFPSGTLVARRMGNGSIKKFSNRSLKSVGITIFIKIRTRRLFGIWKFSIVLMLKNVVGLNAKETFHYDMKWHLTLFWLNTFRQIIVRDNVRYELCHEFVAFHLNLDC